MSKQDIMHDFKQYKEEAPYLYLIIKRLAKEMGDVLWHPAMRYFLLNLYSLSKTNPAWEEIEVRDGYSKFETVARIVLMLKESPDEWPGVYQNLQEATQVPYGRKINDLFAEINGLWEDQKTGDFLGIIADVFDGLLYFREKDDIKKVSADDRAHMADAMPRQPDKLLA